MATRSFQHMPLKGENTFRLLKLHAGQKNDALSGCLQHFTLGSDECPSYRALSYTWDPDFATDGLQMPHGTTISLRHNLQNALRSFRRGTSHCWLWIDAICIDQTSSLERSHQVQLMAQIYTHANIVLVWLQSSLDRGAFSEEAFRELIKDRDLPQSHPNEYSSPAWQCRFDGYIRNFNQLCRLRYWSRKWVIQELVASRTTVLHYGSTKWPMEEFERLCKYLDDLPDRSNEVDANGRPFRWMGSPANSNAWITFMQEYPKTHAVRLARERAENRVATNPQRLLRMLVKKYADSGCQNPCDHIYALYAIVGEHRTLLRVDYSLSERQLFEDVMHFMHQVEALPEGEIFETAHHLMTLLGLTEHQIIHAPPRTIRHLLPMRIHSLGSLYFLTESEQALDARATIKTLSPISRFGFSACGGRHTLTQTKRETSAQQDIGPEEMIYFGMEKSRGWSTSDTRMHQGLASCRIKEDDVIWHLPYTKISFVIRPGPKGCEIIGRAQSLGDANAVGQSETWKKSPWGLSLWSSGVEEELHVDLATMFALRKLADPQQGFGEPKEQEEKQGEQPSPSRWEQAEARRVAREAQEEELKHIEDLAQRRQKLLETAEQQRTEREQRRRADEARRAKELKQAELREWMTSLPAIAQSFEAMLEQLASYEQSWREEDAAIAALISPSYTPGFSSIFGILGGGNYTPSSVAQVYHAADEYKFAGRRQVRDGLLGYLRAETPQVVRALQAALLNEARSPAAQFRPGAALGKTLHDWEWVPPAPLVRELFELHGRFAKILYRCGGTFIEG